ncbi:protein SCAR4 isoform X2 [Eutrema salsugineum]|uniref:protein SCAR4 isoform X2 n=1 Tax=Eutrema salsugineum TaxID=72664 RepID=UPI000CECEB26|nr:protein SCAR4 isoform X2 [Eutrema salsugineum]
MTLTRYQIRNEYGLADKELYQAANKEDPEALLEGASMAGLVGVLRQLGDLAEFAAEVFHCLHEELMRTASRGHGLAMRLQQLEAEFPSTEIPLLSQTDHSTFFYEPGLEWHSNLQPEENLISPRNLPHFLMDSYEECRGPPHLFLLDKFDVVGSGSCLKRYSDPSFLKKLTASAVEATSKLTKDERRRKPKKGSHTTGGERPRDSQASHAKLHQLFLLEHVENGHRNPEFHVKLKRRQLNGPIINSSSGTGYMEKFLKNSSPYCERVHGNWDQSSPAMETEVTVCRVREDLPIPSLVYPNSGYTTKYNEREMESIGDDERLEKPYVPQEITVNDKSLPSIEGGPAICVERSSSVDLCCKTNNDTDAPVSTESDSEHKAGSTRGFPGFGQTQICTIADVIQTEVLGQFSNVLHHSSDEGETSLLCTDIQRSSPESKPHEAEGSGVKVDVSFSQMTPEIDSAGLGTLELEQSPFSFSCYESPPNLLEDSGSPLELQSTKENADEIGLKSSEACDVGRNPMLNNSPGAHPEYLLKVVTQVPLDASEGGTKVLLTNYVEDYHSEHVFSVETESEISLSALVEDQFSSIASQEIEALEPEDNSSDAGHSIPDIKSSLKETSAALESDFLLPNQHISTFDNFEDLSLPADAHDNAVPKEDETNSQDGSSINTEQSGHISTFEISSENGTLKSDFPRDLHAGNRHLSASSWQEDALANPDLAEISSDSGMEDPQTMSTIADDSTKPEVPIPDTQGHSACSVDDVHHDNQTGQNDKASETVPEIDRDPQERLLGTRECFSPESCIQTQDQGQESPCETGSENPITASAKSLPPQGVPLGVPGSPSEEALTSNKKLFPASVTEIESLHAPHQETFTSLNDHISEVVISMDLTDQENCSDVSMVPFSTSLHEKPQADPEITPPLPPLPPTQWWIGKLVESVKTAETQFSPVPLVAGSGNNSSYIHGDETKHNGLVQADEAQYPSAASVTNHGFHVYTENFTVEGESTSAPTNLNEPSKATEEPSPPAVNGTSETYMHNDESTAEKCLYKTPEESFASVSLLTAETTREAESCEGLEADWRSEAMALEWFSQNLREHTDPSPAKLEEEHQRDHQLEPPGEIEFPQTLRDSNSYHQDEKVGKLPRDKDSLVIGIDRSMLRKVSERNKAQVGARVDENDSLLEIIRSKSFNLRPADASVRPNFQVAVPITNLKVAAILEKANTLRQAMAGSDDDHDSDSWSE